MSYRLLHRRNKRSELDFKDGQIYSCEKTPVIRSLLNYLLSINLPLHNVYFSLISYIKFWDLSIIYENFKLDYFKSLYIFIFVFLFFTFTWMYDTYWWLEFMSLIVFYLVSFKANNVRDAICQLKKSKKRMQARGMSIIFYYTGCVQWKGGRTNYYLF